MKIKSYQIKDSINCSKFFSYLIYGQNKGLVKEKTEQIINIYDEKNKGVEVIKLNNDEILEKSEKLFNESNTFSLTRKKKLICVLNAKDKILNEISFILKPNPECLIIFESDELSPKSKLRNFFEKEKNLGVIACYYELENDIRELVDRAFKKENIPLSNSIKQILIQHLGSDRNIIKGEIEKIILFIKNKKNFNQKDILDCLSNNYNFNINDLNYSLCNGNLIQLDKIINQLYLEGINPIILLRSVSKHFQKILYVNENIDNGLSLGDSLKKLKPPIFFLYTNQFKEQVKFWKTKLCNKIIDRMFEAEYLCKINYKISKIICWRTLRNISYIRYKKLVSF